MTACPAYSWGMANQFCKPKPCVVKAFIEPELLDALTSSLITTECANSVRTSLTDEIDNIYEECKLDGWVNNKKEKSIGINYKSTVQAKEFANYIENIEQPYVVPYSNGCIGFDWIIDDKSISIMFKPEGSYVYSIITNTISDYGENKQTSKNQMNLFQRISSILQERV